MLTDDKFTLIKISDVKKGIESGAQCRACIPLGAIDKNMGERRLCGQRKRNVTAECRIPVNITKAVPANSKSAAVPPDKPQAPFADVGMLENVEATIGLAGVLIERLIPNIFLGL